MLEWQQLSFGYDENLLFSDLKGSLLPGQWLMIRGPNGAGKSSLLRLLVGLMMPTQGQVLWQKLSIHQQGTLYHQQLLYLGHANGLTDVLTLEEQLAFDGHWTNSNTKGLQEGMDQLQLDAWKHVPIAKLSKGQQRKAALLRLWYTQAKLWVLDEPFASLDQASTQGLQQCLARHLELGGLLILTSHQEVELDQKRQIELIL